MGTEKVKGYLANFGLADRVMEFKESSATVAEAAADLGCEPARIGKTMAFDVAGQPMLVVIAGDGPEGPRLRALAQACRRKDASPWSTRLPFRRCSASKRYSKAARPGG